MHEESPTWRAFTDQGTPDTLGRARLDAIHPDDREHLEETRIQSLNQAKFAIQRGKKQGSPIWWPLLVTIEAVV